MHAQPNQFLLLTIAHMINCTPSAKSVRSGVPIPSFVLDALEDIMIVTIFTSNGLWSAVIINVAFKWFTRRHHRIGIHFWMKF